MTSDASTEFCVGRSRSYSNFADVPERLQSFTNRRTTPEGQPVTGASITCISKC